jgi:hypothetical protein
MHLSILARMAKQNFKNLTPSDYVHKMQNGFLFHLYTVSHYKWCDTIHRFIYFFFNLFSMHLFIFVFSHCLIFVEAPQELHFSFLSPMASSSLFQSLISPSNPKHVCLQNLISLQSKPLLTQPHLLKVRLKASKHSPQAHF